MTRFGAVRCCVEPREDMGNTQHCSTWYHSVFGLTEPVLCNFFCRNSKFPFPSAPSALWQYIGLWNMFRHG